MATYTPSTGPGAGTPLNFRLLIDPPERQTQQTMAERVIPGATNSVVSIVGKAVTKIRGQARFDSFGALKTFEGVVGTRGSLVYSEEPSGLNVIFVAMSRGRVTPYDVHLASVEFWIIPTSTIVQQITVNADIGGTPITNIISAHISYGFDARTGECRIVTPVKPTGTYDGQLTVSIGTGPLGGGAGTPLTRFVGLVRDFDYNQNPASVTTIARGFLTRAVEYENGEETSYNPYNGAGGLLLPDLIGSISGDAATIVEAVLTKASVPYTSANIDGSSVAYGGSFGAINPLAFMWHSGGHIATGDVVQASDAGESAMSYIERYDNIDAEITGGNDGGRFRTYESLGGIVRRRRVGGRPQSTPDHTLTGGVDVLAGQFKRSISQTRNYFVVKGVDKGGNFGPMNFALQQSNPFQPNTTKHTYSLSSDMIERDTEANPISGMACETVAKALALEFNREIVTGWVETYRDDPFDLAQTHLVQGAVGGVTGPLGVGEPLWVQSLDISVDERGFTQRMTYLGGGLGP